MARCPNCGVSLKKRTIRPTNRTFFIGDLEVKTIPGYKKYAVSKCGKIFYKKMKSIKKTFLNRGYLICRIGKTTLSVHRAVALAYVSGYKDGLEVNHIDGNKENNDIENLEWVTPNENIQHAIENGLMTENYANFIRRRKKYKEFIAEC
jgi:hypothetical protein